MRKSWGELIPNDNLVCNLLNKGFNVWDPAWTKQEAYLKNKSAWKHLKGVQKCEDRLLLCSCHVLSVHDHVHVCMYPRKG